MTNKIHANREAWLNALVEELRPIFSDRGHALPGKVRVTCGFPSSKARSLNRAIGECWSPDASADHATEIMISPVVDEVQQAAAIMVHELCHAAHPKAQHKGAFVHAIRAMHLEGKPTHTVGGVAFVEAFTPIIEALGDYPHAALNVGLTHKKQTTRMLKACCPECGYTIRLTKKWADVAVPDCPVDGAALELDNPETPEEE